MNTQRMSVWLMAGVLALGATAASANVNKSVKIGDGETADGASSVNGSVTVGSNAIVTGDVETVNGTIRIGSGSAVEEVSTVNGSIRISDGVQSSEVSTVNGSVSLGSNCNVAGPVDAVNGKIKVGMSSIVTGGVSNVNGEITLDGSAIQSSVGTVNGDILLTNGASVEGDIKIESPGFSLFNMTKKKRTPRITIGPNSRVTGTIVAEREIELYVHDSASIGGVTGKISMDDVMRFSGDRP